MNYSFCLMTGQNYLTRAIALYESLVKHCPSFTLYYFAFDQKTVNCIEKLNLKNIVVIPIQQIELHYDNLTGIKAERSPAEYFYTCTPVIIDYVMTNFQVDHCIYLDSDIYFFSSPDVLIREMANSSVLITEHRFSEEFLDQEKYGHFCVQFIPFKKDKGGIEVLNWWKNSCIDWCYLKMEDDRYADQKYLNQWPKKFNCVHILNHLGGGVAPWNISQYDFFNKNDNIIGLDKATKLEFDLIFYHFQGLKFINQNEVNLRSSFIDRKVRDLIYRPYIRHLMQIKKRIADIDDTFDPNGSTIVKSTFKRFLRSMHTKYFTDKFNVFKINKFIR